MASEYISFMMVFSLGITMVIAITGTMQGLSDSMYDTTAEVELENLMDNMLQKLYDIHSDFFPVKGEVTFDYNLDFPKLLVNKYYYEISVTKQNGSYILIGSSTSSYVDIYVEKILIFSNTELKLSGTINSVSSNPYMSFKKDFTDQISIEIGNK